MRFRLMMWTSGFLRTCNIQKLGMYYSTAVTSDISWTGILPLEDFNILLIVSLKGEFKQLIPIIEKL